MKNKGVSQPYSPPPHHQVHQVVQLEGLLGLEGRYCSFGDKPSPAPPLPKGWWCHSLHPSPSLTLPLWLDFLMQSFLVFLPKQDYLRQLQWRLHKPRHRGLGGKAKAKRSIQLSKAGLEKNATTKHNVWSWVHFSKWKFWWKSKSWLRKPGNLRKNRNGIKAWGVGQLLQRWHLCCWSQHSRKGMGCGPARTKPVECWNFFQ